MIRATTVLSIAIVATLASAQTHRFDIILRGGLVFDGSGAPGRRADVGVARGRIMRVGDLSREPAAVELDVSNLYVAPGFINIHSHPIADGLTTAANMLTQGVTTEILNPDGGGPIDLAQQGAKLESAGLAINAGMYIGFNSAWINVVGPADRRPTPEDISRMREIVAAGLERGAWGVSAGLDYKPAYFATAREVASVVSVAAEWRTNFTNHDRITPESGFSSRVGITETIDIAREARLVPVITHMKAQGVEQGTAPALSKLMASATASGTYTAADAYPYVAGQSGLGALIVPGWAQEGGRDAMLERFADPVQRTRIVAEAEQAMKARFGGPEGVYVTTIQRPLVDVMRERQVPAGEAIVRLLETRDMGAILRFGSEEDVIALLRHPSTSVACDCGATPGQATHPRYYGSFPRVLGRYVREQKRLTWEDAIRKMSGLPASTIGMVDRGFIAPGMAADIAVFDPATIIDHATFEQPMLPSIGVRHVIVNGRIALRDGSVTTERAGRIVTRARYMPSRPLAAPTRRHVVARGEGVTLDVKHDASAPYAAGTFRWSDGATKIEAQAFGVLQTAPNWASFTALTRAASVEHERAVTVVVDKDALFVEVEGSEVRRIPLTSQRVTPEAR
jgi:N-acyl-D-amino-acid deacylase